MEQFICQFCKKLCKNKNSLVNHERLCKANPNHQESPFIKYNAEKEKAWNKGLNKETDPRVAKQSSTLKERYNSGDLISYWTGKKHTKEEKDKISNSRKKFLSENPDKVPYLINHSSKTSFPEEYFMELFKTEGVDLKYHLQISKYQLDFYNEAQKIDVEIDGEQHFLDERIYESDRNRDIFLSDLGWTVFRIRWSEYQKLTRKQKETVILQIKSLFL